jgi:hypothetical protein
MRRVSLSLWYMSGEEAELSECAGRTRVDFSKAHCWSWVDTATSTMVAVREEDVDAVLGLGSGGDDKYALAGGLVRHETEGAQKATHQWYEVCVAEGDTEQATSGWETGADAARSECALESYGTACKSERDSCGRAGDEGFGGARIAQRANIWDRYSDILRTNQRLCARPGSPSST